MTPTAQRGLDPARSDQDLARLASLRQRAKALGLPLDTPEEEIAIFEESLAPSRAEFVRLNGLPRKDEVAPRETQVETDGDKLMESCGFTAIRLSQRRPSKIHVGLCDRLYLNPSRRLFVLWEAKREGGKQSAKQQEFQALCVACGIPYVVGTTEPLRQWLASKLEAR